MAKTARPPRIDGLSETRDDTPPPFASMLAALAGRGSGKKSSAERGRRIIGDIQEWAESDPRLAPKLSRVIEQLLGMVEDDSDKERGGSGRDATSGSMMAGGEIKTPT